MPGQVADAESQRMGTSARRLYQPFFALRANLVEEFFCRQEGTRITLLLIVYGS